MLERSSLRLFRRTCSNTVIVEVDMSLNAPESKDSLKSLGLVRHGLTLQPYDILSPCPNGGTGRTRRGQKTQWYLGWGNLRGNLRDFVFDVSATVRTVYLTI